MTAQLNDTFRYGDIDYSVAGISEGELFDPAILDLTPSMASTACWRGYQVVYSVLDRHLVAATLHVNLIEKEDESYLRKAGPPINGVVPTGRRESDGEYSSEFCQDNCSQTEQDQNGERKCDGDLLPDAGSANEGRTAHDSTASEAI